VSLLRQLSALIDVDNQKYHGNLRALFSELRNWQPQLGTKKTELVELGASMRQAGLRSWRLSTANDQASHVPFDTVWRSLFETDVQRAKGENQGLCAHYNHRVFKPCDKVEAVRTQSPTVGTIVDVTSR
jgi:hypothetical protein